MECQICSVLDSIRCERIMKYVRLTEQLRRSKRPTAKLEAAISNLRSEADEAWKRLAAHRAGHVFDFDNLQKCQYCGAETLLSNNGRPICEHCAEDLETGRKPPQREKLELRAKATAAG
jgi:uncharacterized protein YuzB (UPF0349 family)